MSCHALAWHLLPLLGTVSASRRKVRDDALLGLLFVIFYKFKNQTQVVRDVKLNQNLKMTKEKLPQRP